MPRNEGEGVLLSGLDGGNPLGFLAAVGTLLILGDSRDCPEGMVRLGWRNTPEGWYPMLAGCGDNEEDVCTTLVAAMGASSDGILDIGKRKENNKELNKFPFPTNSFATVLSEWADCSRGRRRNVDLLAGVGTEIHTNGEEEFQCTSFKMVRSGDSKRQGMLHYVKMSRSGIDEHRTKHTLFERWDYRDDNFGLRWDPIENRSHALQWGDPTKSSKGTMNVANSLAFEALRLLPCVPGETQVQTTGFQEVERRRRFVWPIWVHNLDADSVRSLLSLRDLHDIPLKRASLDARGIQEVYGAWVVHPNQYYSNFAPAAPIS